MTNTELSIDFTTKLNALAGNSFLRFSLEEIDWYLNESMKDVIYKILNRKRSKLQEDLNDTKENIMDLEQLFTSVVLPVNKKSNDIGESVLPPDLLHILEVGANVNTSCSFDAITTSIKTKKYIILPLPNVLLADWLVTMVINSSPVNIFALTDVQNIVGQNLQAQEAYVLVDRILQYVNSGTNYKAYWEVFDGLYTPNNFYIVYEGTGTVSVANQTINGSNTGVTVKSYTKNLIGYTKTTKKVNCRVESPEFSEDFNINPFTKSKKLNPIVTPFRGNLQIRINDFNINNLELSYIRKPRVIDYRTNQSIELGSTQGIKYKIAQKIVDIAVAKAAIRLTSDNAQHLESINI